MREITLVDRGVDEKLLVDGVDVGRVDKLSARQLLQKLHNNNVIELKTVSFDDYKRNE